jgi:hypothetical protein
MTLPGTTYAECFDLERMFDDEPVCEPVVLNG